MTPDALSKKIVASVLEDSEVIRIEADDASQAKALAMVTAVANRYIQSATTTSTNVDAETQLNNQIKSLNASILVLTNQLNAAQNRRLASASPNTPSPEEQQLQTQLANQNTELSNDNSQLNNLAVSDAQAPKVTQLTQPYEAGQVAPKPVRTGIAGALAGMMIAAGVVVLLLRRRLKQLPLDQFG